MCQYGVSSSGTPRSTAAPGRLPMELINRPSGINHDRRRFFGTALMGLAAAQAFLSGSANAQSGNAGPATLSEMKPGTSIAFGPLKQVDAGLLNVGYVETGPAGGPVVLPLHGWPYDSPRLVAGA